MHSTIGRDPKTASAVLSRLHLVLAETIVIGRSDPHLGLYEKLIARLEDARDLIATAGIECRSPAPSTMIAHSAILTYVEECYRATVTGVGEDPDKIRKILTHVAVTVESLLATGYIHQLREERNLSTELGRFTDIQLMKLRRLAETEIAFERACQQNGNLVETLKLGTLGESLQLHQVLKDFHKLSDDEIASAVHCIKTGLMPERKPG